jgi:hypothetical protein
LNDAAFEEHMDDIGDIIIQSPLIMGADDQGALGAAQAVDARGDDCSVSISRPEVM